MRGLFLLVLPAMLHAQPLSMAWPDLPQGVVTGLRHTASFTGASAVASDGQWILAWCDMRDGQGRLMLQKVDPAQPAAPGPWRGDCEAPEEVAALCTPASAITPYLPLVAADLMGGAFVMWQEAVDGSHGDLLLQRVEDGAQGVGSFAWPQPLVVAEDITLPEQDCRGVESRCRDWAEAWRQLAPDGAGGVWLSWRAPDGLLRLQHVDALGARLPSLPAAGLPLPFASWQSRLTGDGAGGARLLCQMQGEAGNPLGVCGLNADGSWTLADTVRVLQGGEVNAFHSAPLEGGRLLVAWSHADGVRAQLLDASLQDRWLAGGLLMAANPAYSPQVAVGQGPQPTLAVAWYEDATGYVAQVLDEHATPRWPAPVSLDQLADGQPGFLAQVFVDGENLLCLVRESDGIHLQRVTADGHGLWPPGSTRLGPPDSQGNTWALASDGAGGAQVGWTRYIQQDRLQVSSHAILHRVADGTEPLDSLQRTVLTERWENGSASRLLRATGDPLVAWTVSDTLFVQAFDGRTGVARWALRQRPVASRRWLDLLQSAPTEDGAWVLFSALQEPEELRTLQALRVDSLGQVLAGPVDVAPGIAHEGDFYDTGHTSVVSVDGGLMLSFECFLGSRMEVRVQRLDAAGNRLWGDAGLSVAPSSDALARSAGLAALGDGSLGVVWALWSSSLADLYLQAVTPEGELRFAENGGRGVHLQLSCGPFAFLGSAQALPDGSLLASLLDVQPDANTRWRLVRVTAQGAPTWLHTEASPTLVNAKVQPDGAGNLWLGRSRLDQGQLRFQLERRTPLGDLERAWSLPQDADVILYDWAVAEAGDDRALTTLDWRPAEPDMRMSAWQLPEGEQELLASTSAPFPRGAAWGAQLAPAPSGDLWLGWEERRGLSMGHGEQSRLARLDILQLGNAVEPPRARDFTLEDAWPNPFNPATRLAFSLREAGPARLEIFNLQGQRVGVVHDGPLAAGRHSFLFNGYTASGGPLASGLYFYRLQAKDRQETRRMLLMR